MNEPITPDMESVLIARLTNKLNHTLTQLANNELFPQVDATARDMLRDRLKEAYALAERIAKQLKEFQKEEPEHKLNLHESALCKVVDRTKDLVGALVEYENEMIERFNRNNRDRSWAVDVAEWFCREVRERFHVDVNPADHSAIYNAKSPTVVIDLEDHPIPCLKRFELHMDPATHKVQLEAHTDLTYTEEMVKRLRIDGRVLQATKNGNGKLMFCASYKQFQCQNLIELFQRLTVRLELIKVRIRALLLEEVA
jgi:hypothetical protein